MINLLLSKRSRTSPYDPNRIRDEAIVNSVLRQGHEWRVHYDGSLWTARLLQSGVSLFPGDIIYIVARQGLVLLAELPLETQ